LCSGGLREITDLTDFGSREKAGVRGLTPSRGTIFLKNLSDTRIGTVGTISWVESMTPTLFDGVSDGRARWFEPDQSHHGAESLRRGRI